MNKMFTIRPAATRSKISNVVFWFQITTFKITAIFMYFSLNGCLILPQ